jgi:hypothetical protein
VLQNEIRLDVVLYRIEEKGGIYVYVPLDEDQFLLVAFLGLHLFHRLIHVSHTYRGSNPFGIHASYFVLYFSFFSTPSNRKSFTVYTLIVFIPRTVYRQDRHGSKYTCYNYGWNQKDELFNPMTSFMVCLTIL